MDDLSSGGARRHVTLITGASSGIGAATARLLAAAGHGLVLVARREERLAALAEELGAGPGGAEVAWVAGDVAAEETARRAVDLAVARFGTLAHLVNNAGYGAFGAFADLSDAQWRRQFEVNVMGCVRFAREALRVMLPARFGTIVNVSSVAGTITFPTGTAYCASKHALEGFTGCLREEVREAGIRVTLVCPGSVGTEFFAVSDGKFRGEERSSADAAWMISPEEVGRLVAGAIQCEEQSFHARIEVRPLGRSRAR